jgi:predicted nicotinamide N-methyase
MTQSLDELTQELDVLAMEREALCNAKTPEERLRLAQVEMELAQKAVAHNRRMDEEPTYAWPVYGWVCFQCGHRFYTAETAQVHFGVDPLAKPSCHRSGVDEEEG